ncbi:hypothetical protein SSAG_03449 [Streptomyces sp. Mg1]|nr:hypothetical protein SSAG_03449 [Streptomyces sp. Mg1]
MVLCSFFRAPLPPSFIVLLYLFLFVFFVFFIFVFLFVFLFLFLSFALFVLFSVCVSCSRQKGHAGTWIAACLLKSNRKF